MAWRVAFSLGTRANAGLLGEINKSAPNRSKKDDGSIGDASQSHRLSDHNPNDEGIVCARDFTHDPSGGFNSYKFAEWLVGQIAEGNELRVKYVISNKKIASGPNQGKPVGVWRTYTGANPHKDHVHVSVRNIPKLYDDKSPWGWA